MSVVLYMDIKRYFYEGLEFVSVKNNDNFVVTFSSLGASILSIELDDQYMTLTPANMDLFKNKFIYHGKTVGRVANRIKDGTFKIGRKTYKVPCNEKTSCLHGGNEGFSNQFFNMDIASNNDEAKITFTYYSTDMEAGFPGNLNVKVIYTVFANENSVCIDYEVTTDKDTLVGLTNHSYFNLGSKSIDDLMLYINSNKYIHPDRDFLYPVEYRPVDKVMDFQTMKHISEDIEADYLNDSWTYGYDHHYCFKEVNPVIPQVVLENNNYKLEIYTNFNGTQIYTDNYPDTNEFEDTDAVRRRAIAIEPQDDTLNREILKAKDVYTRFIRYNFIRK